MTADLTVLVVLVVTALHGAARGALRQLVSFAAAVTGALAARGLSRPVAEGLGRVIAPAARPLAPVLLFLGGFALASLAGALVLRASGAARAVTSPADRAVGALLGGAKGALLAWAVLSALALARGEIPERFAGKISAFVEGSDFYALAREHNLVARLEPGAARVWDEARPRSAGLPGQGGLEPVEPPSGRGAAGDRGAPALKRLEKQLSEELLRGGADPERP